MKYLRTYNESHNTSKRYGDILSEGQFNKLLEKNCKNYIDINNQIKMYRGIGNYINLFKILEFKNHYYLNPKNHYRHSIEPENIHVILMSEMEQWKDFPPYNQSVICSTNKISAESYGELFEIIPYDNTKVGVCSHSSVWGSFGGFGKKSIIKMIHNFLEYYPADWGAIQDEIKNIGIEKLSQDKLDSDFIHSLLYYKEKGVFRYIKKGDYLHTPKTGNSEKEEEEELKNFKKKMDKLTTNDIIEFINFLFEPKNNGFNSIKYDGNYTAKIYKNYTDFNTENLQTWCGGPVLMKKIFI